MNVWLKRGLTLGVFGAGIGLLNTGMSSAATVDHHSPPVASVHAPVTVAHNSVAVGGHHATVRAHAPVMVSTTHPRGAAGTTGRAQLDNHGYAVAVPGRSAPSGHQPRAAGSGDNVAVTAPVTVCGNAVGDASGQCGSTGGGTGGGSGGTPGSGPVTPAGSLRQAGEPGQVAEPGQAVVEANALRSLANTGATVANLVGLGLLLALVGLLMLRATRRQND